MPDTVLGTLSQIGSCFYKVGAIAPLKGVGMSDKLWCFPEPQNWEVMDEVRFEDKLLA